MARLNPRRRRQAKQAQLFLSIRSDHGPTHDDSAKLQQGKVGCAMERHTRNYAGMARPRHISLSPDFYKDGAKMVDQRGKGKLPPFKPRKGDFTLY